MNTIMRCTVAILCVTILVAAPASADPPSELSIQGLLTSNSGQVAPDGNYGMTFKLFTAQEGGEALFTDISPAVAVKNGRFTFSVGSAGDLNAGIFDTDGAAWVEIKVDNEPELPRVPLKWVPFAFVAQAARTLSCSGCVKAEHIDPNVIGGSLHPVATSGQYNDLDDKPDLSVFVTQTDFTWGNLGNKPELLKGDTGETGAIGAPGHIAVTRTSPVSAGPNCATGGVLVEAGVDNNDNKVLDDNEITSAAYICNGLKGELGATGSKGDQGDTGSNGPKGDQGATGPKGDPGNTGATGTKGDPGNTGAQGAKGDPGNTGATGATGPQGSKGNTGAQGTKGNTGATGATGPQGSKGNTGAQGTKGNTGATGAKGNKGDTGATGPAGPKTTIGRQSCAWTGYVNTWDGAMNYICPNSGFIAGLYSYHDNGKEDRIWKFYCCRPYNQ